MYKNPVIGIITANYNNGKYFEEYLKGIFDQTVKPNFVSIVDDGSKDNSVEIINKALNSLSGQNNLVHKGQFCVEYNIKGITFIFSSYGSNHGPASARNLAASKILNHANIIFVYDSDDIYYPKKIEETLKIFKQYPNAKLVYSDYDTLDERTLETKREFKEPFSYYRLCNECIVSNNSAFDKETFLNIGGYDEELFGPEDYDLWLRLAEKGPVFHIPKPLYKYRLSGNNITIATPKEQFAQHVQRVHQKRINRLR